MGGDVSIDSQPGRTVVTVGARRRGARARRGADQRFHVKTRADGGYSGRMRAGAIAVVALVAAALGSAVHAARRQRRRLGRTATTLRRHGGRRDAAGAEASAPAADGLVARRLDFNPARIYARSTPGVVTIYALFDGGGRAQGSGFIVSDDGHVLTNSHVITSSGEAASEPVRGASSVYVVFADGDRLPAEIVGWDLFNDTGVIKVDPRGPHGRPLAAGRLRRRRRRRAGGGDRQSVRERELARGRGRLRGLALDTVPDLALQRLERDPGRRSDQPRQLRRPAARRPRPRDRDQRADPLRLGERRGRRLRDPDQLRPPLDGAADLDRSGAPTPTSGSRPRTSPPRSPAATSSAPSAARSSRRPSRARLPLALACAARGRRSSSMARRYPSAVT